jgi:hypothetical protein
MKQQIDKHIGATEELALMNVAEMNTTHGKIRCRNGLKPN